MDERVAFPYLQRCADAVERLAGDRRLDPLMAVAGRVAERVAPAGPTRAALRGAADGHPMHPWLTDVVIGSWTSAMVLDLVGGRSSQKAAKRLVALGVLSAVPTVATGWAEWADAEDDPGSQRIGVVHAVTNAAATGLYALSWRARHRHQHLRGVALGLVGGTVATVGGYLGGHLAYRRGVGQTRPAVVVGLVGDHATASQTSPGRPTMASDDVPVPSDNTTLSEVVAGYEQAGFTVSLRIDPGGTIFCRHCNVASPADRFDLHSLRRLEGVSDPDDAISVAAVACANCKAKGLLVLPYGPEAGEDETLVYLALQDRRGSTDLGSAVAPGEHGDNTLA